MIIQMEGLAFTVVAGLFSQRGKIHAVRLLKMEMQASLLGQLLNKSCPSLGPQFPQLRQTTVVFGTLLPKKQCRLWN